MSKAILSVRYPQFAEKLRRLGYDVIPSETVDTFIPYERDHADLQCLIIDDTAFVLSRCKRLTEALRSRYTVVSCGDHIGITYPQNVALSAKIIGKNLIARLDTLDPQIIRYASSHGYRLINVKQGYAACAITAVSGNALITADEGVIKTLAKTGIDVLAIGKGHIRLGDTDQGFIGGASGLLCNNGQRILYFAGNIAGHPDYATIKSFCEQHGTTIRSLSDDVLTDVGGIIFSI